MKLHELIKPEVFREIYKSKLSLNDIYYLSLLSEDIEVKSSFLDNLCIIGYCKDGKITVEGMKYLESVYSPKYRKKVKKSVEYSPEFLEWWGVFPATDNFTHGGVLFKGSRNLKTKKDGCMSLFSKIQLDKDILIKALNNEINAFKNKSVVSNTNQMQFFQNSYTYLYQKTYENWINIEDKTENKIVNTEDLF